MVKLYFLVLVIIFSSCTQEFLNIKKIVQKNCDSYIDRREINIISRSTYYIGTISNDPIYSNGYLFLVLGNEWDDVIMVVDDQKLYYLEDSLYKRILEINSQLIKKRVEIEAIYINSKDRYSIRARNSESKYLYKVVEVKDISELLIISFDYAGHPLQIDLLYTKYCFVKPDQQAPSLLTEKRE